VAHDIQSILPTRQRHLRFGTILGRQFRHRIRIHIRWIGNDELVWPNETREQIASNEANAVLQAVIPDVFLCDLERIGREFGCVHPGVGESMRQQDRQAA